MADVVMPQMGVSVSEGTVAQWRKQPGDAVSADEIICSISTDKIDTDIEAPASGVLAEILVPEGQTVPVGTVLARIDGARAGNGATATPEMVADATSGRKGPGPDRPMVAGATTSAAPPRRSANGPRYSPVVQRIAAEHGIDLSSVVGTGRGGRVRKQDVLAVVEGGGAAVTEPPMHIESPYRYEPPPPRAAPAAAPVGDLGGVVEPLSRMRLSIGRHMKASLDTAATCTTIVECDMSAVERVRKALGTTYLPVVARAVIDTLRAFPSLNATLEGETFTRYDRVHLGIAVSLGEDGLIVPVVHDAQELSVEGLATRIKALAERARNRELRPDDVAGGTFTITNPGAFGAVLATPVINQPQVGILDLEAVVKRPVVIEGDAIAVRPMTYFCLSWDHRAIDGAYAAQFLTALRKRLEAL